MKFELYKDVVLTHDVPEERLKRGDIVKLVEHHVARDGENGYSAEVFNAVGDTLAGIRSGTAASRRSVLRSIPGIEVTSLVRFPRISGISRRTFPPLGCNLPGCVRASRNLPPLPAKSRPVNPCNLCPFVTNKPSRLRAFAVKFRPVNKDRLTQARRSWNRSRIRAKDTMPEKAVGRATATGCSRVHARTAGME